MALCEVGCYVCRLNVLTGWLCCSDELRLELEKARISFIEILVQRSTRAAASNIRANAIGTLLERISEPEPVQSTRVLSIDRIARRIRVPYKSNDSNWMGLKVQRLENYMDRDS